MPFIAALFLLFIPVPSQAQKPDASYEVGKDLILLQSTASSWYHTKGRTNYGNLPPKGYHGIYWNPKDNSYYYAHGDGTNLYVTNGLTYKLDISKQETNYTLEEVRFIDYAGSLNPLERLYIDKKDGTQYIKHLIQITNDPFPLYPESSPEPDRRSDMTIYVEHTNAQGGRFIRVPENYRISNGVLSGNRVIQ